MRVDGVLLNTWSAIRSGFFSGGIVREREVSSRRILHVNVTDHLTAEWTIQQFREFLAYDHPYRIVIHDRDAIFSRSVDLALRDFGARSLKTPVRTPTANVFCERVIGTIRRDNSGAGDDTPDGRRSGFGWRDSFASGALIIFEFPFPGSPGASFTIRRSFLAQEGQS
jgi:transposase InsO family protein